MKPSTILGSTFLIFLILLTKSPLNSSGKSDVHPTVTAALIDRICTKTETPDLCGQTLSPLTGQPYLIKLLLPAVIRRAKGQVNRARETFMNLLETQYESDEKLRQLRMHCYEGLEKVEQQLEEAENVLNADKKSVIKERTKAAIKIHAGAAMDVLEICGRKSSTGRLAEPSVAASNRDIHGLCRAILVIFDVVPA